MARPEYSNDNGIASIETWQEACALSQEWADGARLAAHKRRRRNRGIITALYLALMLASVAVLFILAFDIQL